MLASASGRWLSFGGGKQINFYRQPFLDHFWLRILNPYITSLFFFTLPKVASDSFRNTAMFRICSTLSIVGLKTLIFHPFEVASLHYLLQPPGSVLNFRSTIEALVRIARCNPYYLWTGVLENLVSNCAQAVLSRETSALLGDYFQKKRVGSWAVGLIATAVDVAMLTPLRTLSSRAMSRTPLLRSLPGLVQYQSSTFEHAKQIWTQEGVMGFYRGWPFVIAARALNLLLFSVWRAFSDYTKLYRYRKGMLAVPVIAALSLSADLAGLRPVELPWDLNPSLP